jgi:hypothetical protein
LLADREGPRVRVAGQLFLAWAFLHTPSVPDLIPDQPVFGAKMDWLQLAVLIVCVGLFCWWMSGFSVRHRDAYNKYLEAAKSNETTIEMYRESLDLTKRSNLLRTEELAVMRELIAELRAGRQSPGAPPASEKLSN